MTKREQYPAPPGFASDGCTVPAIFKPLYRRYTEACRWHDWARRHLVYYGICTVPEADREFIQHMRDITPQWWWAPLIWITAWVVKRTRDKYSATLPVPKREWLEFVREKGAADVVGAR